MKTWMKFCLLLVSFNLFGQGSEEVLIREAEHTPLLKKQIEKTVENAQLAKEEAAKKKETYSAKDYEFWHKDGWGFNTRFGFLDSSYNDINGGLSNGSYVWGFGIYQNLKEGRWKINYGIDLIFSKDDDLLPENTRATQFRVQPEYHFLISDRFHIFTGLGVVVADYNIRRVTSDTGSQQTFDIFATGTAFGATVDVGTRYAFNNTIAVDLAVGYLQYFDSPQNNIGGFSFLPRINFNF